ncbi:two-component system sensor histidine kinase NtrB [Desulfoscipio gibsoniae]|uniref:histidine kinase n=1 Tax=Desulfoscipio gibsoniae DSM 7213 TaxID=767817 RepID=R4KJ69_9FIRM|nr:ATP-binding protein [Desulfoscipio gibsoniae]AGL00540.1 PAS domain S-box [Desulfoscipio gibsoniae DSM 7213]
MKKRYNSPDCWKTLREKLIGLGEHSIRKSYYPELQQRLIELEVIENELRKHQNHLESLVKERTSELKSANEQLKQEIAERKQAEEALRLSEEFFSKAFNSSPIMMSIIRFSDYRYINVNDTFLHYTGYSREEVIGRTAVDLNVWIDVNKETGLLRLLQEQGAVYNKELRLRTKSGDIREVIVSKIINNINGEKCILGVAQDITEKKQFEKEIARLERLNLVGQIAAGIGHEIRNPMTTVRGFLQILGGKEKCIEYKKFFNLMIEELDRANFIITEFLSLANHKALDKKDQNINAVLKTLLPLMQADSMNIDKYVVVELGETPDFLMNEKEIRQLVLNLVRNGLEAMPPGGTLKIKTFTDGGEVVLSVQDQGMGIEPDVIEKIGTPFFTTKDNGTGLGLAVCYSIAARHNAIIKVETSPTGTTFFVRFKI